MLRRNIRYKLLALVIALIIWGYASLGQNPQVTKQLQVPVDMLHLDPDLVPLNAPGYARISLEGQRSYVDTLMSKPKSVTAYIDLGGRTAGQHVLPVVVSIREPFKSFVTASAIPGEAVITLEEKARRAIPVDVQIVGSPPVGYSFGKPELLPAQAAVSGAAKRVGAVAKLIVMVDARKATARGVDADAAVIPQGKDGNAVQDVEVIPAKVHLRLGLIESAVGRIVYVSANLVGQPSFPYKVAGVTVKPQTVTVLGRPDQLKDVTTVGTEPVNVGNRTESFAQRVRLTAPKGLAVAEGGTVRVAVEIISSEPEPAPEPAKGN